MYVTEPMPLLATVCDVTKSREKEWGNRGEMMRRALCSAQVFTLQCVLHPINCRCFYIVSQNVRPISFDKQQILMSFYALNNKIM